MWHALLLIEQSSQQFTHTNPHPHQDATIPQNCISTLWQCDFYFLKSLFFFFFFRASSRLKYKSHNQMGLLPRCCSRRVTYSWRVLVKSSFTCLGENASPWSPEYPALQMLVFIFFSPVHPLGWVWPERTSERRTRCTLKAWKGEKHALCFSVSSSKSQRGTQTVPAHDASYL